MNEYFENYTDWFYIGSVILAFFVFLLWNKKRQSSGKRSQRLNFKKRIAQKREKRERES